MCSHELLRYSASRMAQWHTRQLLKVWSLVKSVIFTGIITGLGQPTAVTGVTI